MNRQIEIVTTGAVSTETYIDGHGDERRLDAVEELITLADDAVLPLALRRSRFTTAHPAVSSAIIGPRTMDHPRIYSPAPTSP